ncbi:MAG: pentapeptide repeat-containing protein [Anaerolineales bacterium]|nr:pentapeptide repeat-containing protein [Anaerolineales bacterium]
MVLSNPKQKEYTSQEFKKLVFKTDQVMCKEFDDCTFIKCAFNDTVFQNCKFRDCTFNGCDLSLVGFEGCSFANTRFEDSQLISINWTETAWANAKVIFKPVDFYDCVINYSTFLGMDLKNVTLSKCIAREVSFEEANLTQADCRFTDFLNSRFIHTNLTEADFTGAKNYTIAANLNTLKKTKFSLPEAMSLLYNLDICLTEYNDEAKPHP